MTPLSRIHTRTLLQWRNACYGCGGAYDPSEGASGIRYPATYTLAEIKAELATREHVPNKREARILRQQKAKKRC